jgi:hypothetical protein
VIVCMLTFPDPEPYTSHQLWKVAASEVANILSRLMALTVTFFYNHIK